ncbi:MAG: hypothetical protein KBC06_02645 [Candidatus Pacebacteria bacterium]|nr:hypothetical protein [Candidatus Paceibacterota bacterium]
MVEIIPAVIPKNYEDLKNNIALVRGVVPVVQIDICDGIFVKNITWPFHGGEFDQHFQAILNEQEGMPFWEDIDFELDMMVASAVENFDLYTKLGPKRIIFHLEAVGDLEEFQHFLEGIDMYVRDSIQIGVAINPSTPLEKIFPLTNYIDFVQCMGSDELGFHGVELDEKVYDRIKTLREKYFDLPIAVDIGVNMDTAPRLVESGATKLIAGSAIFNTDDIIGRVEWFKNL